MADKVKCVIVSGAPNDCSAFLKRKISDADYVIAADAGYLHLKKAGIIPDLIIGDFDSSALPEESRNVKVLPTEKEFSDTFHCVIYAVEHGFSEIEIVNAIGSRFDHSYANLLCLDYCKKQGVKCCLSDACQRISLITDSTVIKKEYAYFSLFAFLEDCEGVTIKGAYYTAGWYGKEALRFSLTDQCGVSNYITESECEISLKKGTLLLIEAND